MLGIALDVVALVVITSILARQSMLDEWHLFAFFALGLVIVGAVLSFAALPLPAVLLVYLAVLGLGFRFVIGATWLGAVVGCVLFLLYKLGLAMVLA
ncbi:MAG: hypothetical protein HY721_09225 [Planctomycetes bacterium]|nr:hypothetical protein [Planctomycetota bacterium]